MGRTTMEAIRRDIEGLSLPMGLTPAFVVGLPESLRRFLLWVIRSRAVTCQQAAEFLGETEKEACNLIADLSVRGIMEHVPTCGFPVYRVCLEPRRLIPPPELRHLLGEEERTGDRS